LTWDNIGRGPDSTAIPSVLELVQKIVSRPSRFGKKPPVLGGSS
jgi:hypothetical protein